MLYLDNAATTRYKPFRVIWTQLKETFFAANPGRGGHRASLRAAIKVEKVREEIQKLYFEGNVIFTKNCTEALNLALNIQLNHKKVITSYAEHNSVLRPLKRLSDQGKIHLKIISPTTEAFEKEVGWDTGMVVMSVVSNVTGHMHDIEKILKIVKEKSEAITVVDGAQSGGKCTFFMGNVDMFACSGHKGLYGPQGTGFLLAKKGVVLEPLMVGGTGSSSFEVDLPKDIPEGMEAGTVNASGIIALGKAVKYIAKKGEKIALRENRLTTMLKNELGKENNITVYSAENGILLFNINHLSCSEVADQLSKKYAICVRSGLHCAPLMHRQLHTLPEGAVRVSFGRMNNIFDINYAAYAIRKIAQSMNENI